jgi:hypothetical protein
MKVPSLSPIQFLWRDFMLVGQSKSAKPESSSLANLVILKLHWKISFFITGKLPLSEICSPSEFFFISSLERTVESSSHQKTGIFL